MHWHKPRNLANTPTTYKNKLKNKLKSGHTCHQKNEGSLSQKNKLPPGCLFKNFKEKTMESASKYAGMTCVPVVASTSTMQHTLSSLEIRAPDDLHLHLRDDDRLRDLLKIPLQFKRAIIMPNLKPPVITTKLALAYRERIMQALGGCNKGWVNATCLIKGTQLVIVLSRNAATWQVWTSHDSLSHGHHDTGGNLQG